MEKPIPDIIRLHCVAHAKAAISENLGGQQRSRRQTSVLARVRGGRDQQSSTHVHIYTPRDGRMSICGTINRVSAGVATT